MFLAHQCTKVSLWGALTPFKKCFFLRLFVVVYNPVIAVLMNSYGRHASLKWRECVNAKQRAPSWIFEIFLYLRVSTSLDNQKSCLSFFLPGLLGMLLLTCVKHTKELMRINFKYAHKFPYFSAVHKSVISVPSFIGRGRTTSKL